MLYEVKSLKYFKCDYFGHASRAAVFHAIASLFIPGPNLSGIHDLANNPYHPIIIYSPIHMPPRPVLSVRYAVAV